MSRFIRAGWPLMYALVGRLAACFTSLGLSAANYNKRNLANIHFPNSISLTSYSVLPTGMLENEA